MVKDMYLDDCELRRWTLIELNELKTRKIVCPNCNYLFNYVGTKILCPNCKYIFDVNKEMY